MGRPGKTGPDRLDLAPTGTMTTPRAQTARAGAEKVKSSITKRTIDIVGAVIAGILAAPPDGPHCMRDPGELRRTNSVSAASRRSER